MYESAVYMHMNFIISLTSTGYPILKYHSLWVVQCGQELGVFAQERLFLCPKLIMG